MSVFKVLVCIFLLLLIFQVSPRYIFAKVLINEFSSQSNPDWIELYSPEDVDISGWYLYDNTSQIASVSAGIKIGPNFSKYYTLDVDSRLNKDEDVIKLYNSLGLPVDSIPYGGHDQVCAPSSTESAGRVSDGGNTIDRFKDPTKGAENSSNLDPCPSPSPTNTPTPEPTNTPTPTNTVSPTVKPTLRPTSIPVPSDYVADNYGGASESDILGLRNQINVTPTASPAASTKGPISFLPYILVLGGAGFLGFSGFNFFKKSRMGYNQSRRRRLIKHERET